MRALLVSLVAAAMAVTACGGGTGSAPTSPEAPPAASAKAGPAAADTAAKAYDAAVAAWTHRLRMQTAELPHYPEQISLQHDTAKQLAAQRTDCANASAALAALSAPPTLAAMPASGSTAYPAAVMRAKGTTTIDGARSSCAAGATCFTPDQRLWPEIATLWRRQGSYSAAGVHRIQRQHVACLLAGWESVCTAAVEWELAYQKWADEYAAAFDQGSTATSGGTATAHVKQVGAAYTAEVITPTRTAMTSAYAKLVQPRKYDSDRSLVGEDLWIQAIRLILKSLSRHLAEVGT